MAPNPSSPRPPVRWWPLLLIAVAVGIALLRLWVGEAQNAQLRVMQTFQVLGLGLLGALLWLLVLSRLPWRRRLAVLGALVLVGGALPLLFRIEGVTGNLVPILSFRWAGDTDFEARSGVGSVSESPLDFPQFLGPSRDARLTSVRLDPDWEAAPPRELWRREVGDAWSGFAVVGDAAVTLEQHAGREVVVRYDLATGEIVWTHDVEASFDSTIGGNGPRSTPTIADGRVYTLGATGILRAMDLASGELSWSRSLQDDHGSEPPSWGFAGSPLVLDDKVIVPAGGEGRALVAYQADTGEPAWQGGNDRVGYSSASLHRLAGVEQIVVFNGASVSGHDPASGALLWSFPWSGDQPNVAQPLVVGEDRLLVSSGYGIGAALLEVRPDAEEGWQVDALWRSPRLKAKFTNPVLHDGFVYGLDDGVLVCLDPATGDRRWKRGRYGHGQVLLVSGLLLVQTEGGEIVLVEATPEAHREVARFEALTGKSWNPPTLSGSRLLVRNAQEAAAFELPLRSSDAVAHLPQ